MLTLAAIVALPQELQGTPVAAVLFLGLAATFGCFRSSRSGFPRNVRPRAG